MKKVLKVLSIGIIVALIVSTFSGCGAYEAGIKEGNKEKLKSLQVHDDGSFRILQLTDTHLISNGKNKRDKQTLRWIEEAIDTSKPDLVVMSGDITGNSTKERDKGILAVANLLESKKVYWTYAFGNHDGEHGKNEENKEAWLGKEGTRTEVSTVCKNADYDKSKGELFYGDNTRGNKQIFDLLTGFEYCLVRQDPLEAEHSVEMGIGNYTIDLTDKDGNVVFALIHMDCHGKTYFEPKGNTEGAKGYKDAGYLGLTDMQIEWYKNTVKPYAEKGIKTAIFMHIPNYGYREITEVPDGTTDYGMPKFKEMENVADAVKDIQFKDTKFLKTEGIYAPRWDDGLEQAMDEYKSTNLIAVGHDHSNCFYLEKNIKDKFADEKESDNNIILAYGRCSGVNAWGRMVDIGATVYDINTNGNTINDMYEIEEIYPSFKYVQHYKPAEIDARNK